MITAANSGRANVRPSTDFYPTPPSATRALLSVERFNSPIWEPACGDGSLSRELERIGLDVVSTDLYAHGYGTYGVDFLRTDHLFAPVIVTNPPFKHADAFVRHALSLRPERVVFLLRLAYLEGMRRSDILEGSGLARVHVFRNRVTMAPKGVSIKNHSAIAFAWFVWERGYTGQPIISRITAQKEAA